MNNEIIHLYGPFAIRSYGLFIALGILLFTWLLQKNPRFKQLHIDDGLYDIIVIGIMSGILGGRLLFALSEPEHINSLTDFFAFWQGGFSILGGVLGILITVTSYLYYKQIPVIALLDVIAIYAPLLQSVSRIGCFFAGCCYGQNTALPWGVIYTDSQSAAPLNQCIHPTQLYSSLILFIIFMVLYRLSSDYPLIKPGRLLCAYLFLSSAERFFVDFWRADRIFITTDPVWGFFTIHQFIALAIMIGAGITGIVLSNRYKNNS